MSKNTEQNKMTSSPLAQALLNAPRDTGVYIMNDASHKIIYVGKAKNIKSRIRAYANQTDSRASIPFLTASVATVEFIVTNTEKEALILENNLIKLHRPRYNIFFRDDRSYYCITIDTRHQYPGISLVRESSLAAGKHFGPLPSSASARETLRFLQSLFPLRTCSDRELAGRARPCVEYQIKRCAAPCAGRISDVDYHQLVSDSISFLDGGQKQLLKLLKARMKNASAEYAFEKAVRLRDRIAAIEKTIEKQIVSMSNMQHRDIFGIYNHNGRKFVCAMFMRLGKVLGVKHFPSIKTKLSEAATLSSVLKLYYSGNASLPNEIIIPQEIEDKTALQEWLTQTSGRQIKVIVPQRGQLLKLTELAYKNACAFCESQTAKSEKTKNTLQTLLQKLSLENIPHSIECFDISNISGKYATGSKVNFVNGEPNKNCYRRFKIKTVTGSDDYAMMRELLGRRFRHHEDAFPALVVIDGGKGQLAVALSVLAALNITGIDVIALAKERVGNTEVFAERVYLPRRKNAVKLPKGSSELLLLMHIRDEAHRFALSYHRKLRERIF